MKRSLGPTSLLTYAIWHLFILAESIIIPLPVNDDLRTQLLAGVFVFAMGAISAGEDGLHPGETGLWRLPSLVVCCLPSLVFAGIMQTMGNPDGADMWRIVLLTAGLLAWQAYSIIADLLGLWWAQ